MSVVVPDTKLDTKLVSSIFYAPTPGLTMSMPSLVTLSFSAIISTAILGMATAQTPPIKFQDVTNKLSFVHVSKDGGLGGAAWLDFDNDGDLDLFLPNGKGGKNALYENQGNGNLTDVAGAANVDGTGMGFTGVVAGDIDNDGFTDLFLTGDGGLMGPTQSPTRLYRNAGNGTFLDVTATAGVPGAETSLSAALGDIDNDGDLDIFITSPGSLFSQKQHKNKLYLNDGNMKFTDISQSAGIDTSLGACVCSFTDYDRDGFVDIIVGVCNDVFIQPTPFKLFRNLGNLKFVDVASQAGLTALGFWMSISLGDIDNDGDIDLFSTSLGNSTAYFPHALYRNNGNNTYTDIASQSGVANWEFGWGSVLTDVDNDGALDLFYAGSLPLFRIIGPGLGSPGRLFFNDGTGKMAQIGNPQPGNAQPVNMASMFSSGVTQGDFDNDGFPDIVVITDRTGTTDGRPVFLRNGGNANSWITIRPVGTQSNRGGVGAFIEVYTGHTTKQVREVRAGSSAMSSETPWPTVGVGTAKNVTVRIEWPSGTVDIYPDLQTRQTVTLVEGQGKGAGSFQPSGVGCAGSAGVPVLAAAPGQNPAIGKTFGVEVTSIPQNAPTILIVGASNSTWGTIPLPLALGFLGMPNCTAYQSLDILVPMTTNGGTATFSAQVPSSPLLVGAVVYTQALVDDATANAFGAVVSNAATAIIGTK